MKECESLVLLGEVGISGLHPDNFDLQVSLENSNFKQAVEDLMTCLAKRLKALPADSRYIDSTFIFVSGDVYPGPLPRPTTSSVLLKLTARTSPMPRRV